jgi:Rrf2 family transcriptional regulator, iron-sulfur cluster assembly transcription factor
MLSNTSKYAIRAVIYLALKGDDNIKIGIKEISKELDIPTPFLGKILQSLAKHKLLVSTKGPHGGFGLGKDASEISLMDVVEVIDGIDNFNSCLLGLKDCTEDNRHCPIHHNFATIRDELKSLFQSENIGAIAKHIRENSNAVAL